MKQGRTHGYSRRKAAGWLEAGYGNFLKLGLIWVTVMRVGTDSDKVGWGSVAKTVKATKKTRSVTNRLTDQSTDRSTKRLSPRRPSSIYINARPSSLASCVPPLFPILITLGVNINPACFNIINQRCTLWLDNCTKSPDALSSKLRY